MKKHYYNFLRWTAQWTQTDMIYLANNGFWVFLCYTVTAFMSFLLVLIMTRVLSQEAYGLYAFVIAVINILQLTTLPGIITALTQAISRGYEGSLRRATKLRLCWGLVGAFICLGLAFYYQLSDRLTLALSLSAIGLIFPFIHPFSNYESLLIGRSLFKVNALYKIIFQTFVISLPLFTLLVSKNLIATLLATFLSASFAGLIFFLYTIKKYQPNTLTDEKTIPYGFHLSALSAIKFIGDNLDKILIFYLFGATNLAIYALALMPIKKFQDLNALIREISLPKLSQRPNEALKKSLTRKILLLSLAWLLVALVYWLIAPLIYKIFFPAYTNSSFFSRLLALTLVLLPGDFYLVYFRAKMKKKLLYISTIMEPALRLSLFLILIPKFQILGAIASIATSQTLVAGLNYYLFKKY